MIAMATESCNVSVSLVRSGDALKDVRLRMEWESLLERLDSPNLLYSSPDWFEHVTVTEPEGTWHLVIVRDAEHKLVGICPVRQQSFDLSYEVSNRTVWKSKLAAANVYGSDLVAVSSPAAYGSFFAAILESLPRCACIYLGTIPTNSSVYEYVQHERVKSERFFIHLPYGNRPWHLLDVKGDFESFLKAMGSKTRTTLRRKVRQMRDHGAGDLDFACTAHETEVPTWLEKGITVSKKTWQHRVLGPRLRDTREQRASLQDLARRGLLRAYSLSCGGEPVAFLLGYQYRGVYQYEETGFDESLSDLSPGTVLLFLAIEDLFQHNPPSVINFGIGDAVHKRRFANRETSDAAVVVCRKTLMNRVRLSSHKRFQDMIDLAKRIIGRRVTK
jgi:CelD/BcsL family acetyltransferase involved in cellulose biosynthesis